MILLGLLLACTEWGPLTEGEDCDPRLLSAGQVRARQVPCKDELQPYGEGRSGDWVIENAVARFVVRDAPNALTRLGVAGGTIVDAAPPGVADAMLEAVPLIGGVWAERLEIEPWSSGAEAGLDLRGTLAGGDLFELRYALSADEPTLQIEGADTLSFSPGAGSGLVGAAVEARTEPSAPLLYATDGAVTDLGGWVEWSSPTRLVVGERAEVYAALWPEGVEVAGSSDGEWLSALDHAGVTLARLRVEDGAFAGRLPPEAVALRASASGYATGPSVTIDTDMSVNVGEAGAIYLHAVTDHGTEIPVTLWWGDTATALGAGGGVVPVGAGVETVRVTAGPAWEAATFAELRVEGDTRVEAVLRRATRPATLIDTHVAAWPGVDERRAPSLLADRLAADGLRYAVLVAQDEVALDSVAARTAPWITLDTGSRAMSPVGSPYAWPYGWSSRAPAHGATEWAGLDAADLLAALEDQGRRLTVADPAWLEAAGDPLGWDPLPFAIELQALSDLPQYVALLDRWTPLALFGPRTWLLGVDDETAPLVDVLGGLLAGRRVATNGPLLELRWDPSPWGAPAGLGARRRARLSVEAPAWMSVRHAALIGPGGSTLASWELEDRAGLRLDAAVTLPDVPWVLAICWGDDSRPPLQPEPAWAVTEALWLAEP